MFKFTDMASQKGSAIANEDVINITEYGAWVLDGATSLNEKCLVDNTSDAKWYVNWWDNYLTENISSNHSLKHIMENGIDMVKNEFIKLSGIKEFKEIDMPSSGISIIKWNLDKTSAEYLNLGDCILVYSKNDENIVFYDKKIEQLDSKVLNKINYLTKEQGLTLDQAKTEVFDEIIENRKLKNTPNGYYILGFDKTAIEKATNGHFKLDDNVKIFMATDGFTALYNNYKYTTLDYLLNNIEKKGIESFISILRDIENNDATGILYPRYKIHDDASALYIHF